MFGQTIRIGSLSLFCGLMAIACDAGQSSKRNTKLAHTHFLLGQDYVRRKNPEAAKQELLKAIEHDPENRDAHNLLGVIFFLEGVHAMNFLERQQCLTGQAAVEQQQTANDRFREAEKHFLLAVKHAERDKRVDPDDLNYLANVALHLRRYDDAIAHCSRALENILYSNRYMALATRGWAFYKKGKLAEAARDLRQSLFHQPQFCIGRFRLAMVYYDQKNYDRAASELTRAVDDKACPLQEPFHLLGLVYTKQRKTSEARALFDRCIAHNPKSCIAVECRRYAKLIGN